MLSLLGTHADPMKHEDVGVPLREFTILDFLGRSRLHVAILRNNVELASRYLSDAHTRADDVDQYGRTPFMTAVYYHRQKILEMLALSGKFLDPKHSDYEGNTVWDFIELREEMSVVESVPVPDAFVEDVHVRKGTNMKIT